MNNDDGLLVQLGLWSSDDDVLVGKRVQKRLDECGATPEREGTLESDNKRQAARGRALALAEWIVDHQERINATAPGAG